MVLDGFELFAEDAVVSSWSSDISAVLSPTPTSDHETSAVFTSVFGIGGSFSSDVLVVGSV